MRAGERVEPILERDALGLRQRGDLAEDHRGADAVLVAHDVADEVAERLFVAEHEAGAGRSSAARAIHLNPVSVSAYCTPAAAAIFESIVDDTTVVATSRSEPEVCRST